MRLEYGSSVMQGTFIDNWVKSTGTSHQAEGKLDNIIMY